MILEAFKLNRIQNNDGATNKTIIFSSSIAALQKPDQL